MKKGILWRKSLMAAGLGMSVVMSSYLSFLSGEGKHGSVAAAVRIRILGSADARGAC